MSLRLHSTPNHRHRHHVLRHGLIPLLSVTHNSAHLLRQLIQQGGVALSHDSLHSVSHEGKLRLSSQSNHPPSTTPPPNCDDSRPSPNTSSQTPPSHSTTPTRKAKAVRRRTPSSSPETTCNSPTGVCPPPSQSHSHPTTTRRSSNTHLLRTLPVPYTAMCHMSCSAWNRSAPVAQPDRNRPPLPTHSPKGTDCPA